MDDAARIADRPWYRKTMKALTKEQLEAELEAKLEAGEITAEEAEQEWQDFTNPLPQYMPGIGYRGD